MAISQRLDPLSRRLLNTFHHQSIMQIHYRVAFLSVLRKFIFVRLRLSAQDKKRKNSAPALALDNTVKGPVTGGSGSATLTFPPSYLYRYFFNTGNQNYHSTNEHFTLEKTAANNHHPDSRLKANHFWLKPEPLFLSGSGSYQRENSCG